MVRNVILKYPNDVKVAVDRLVCYKINNLQKKFLIYTTNETDGDNVVAYFGELVDYTMAPVKSEDLEELRNLLMEMAYGTLQPGHSNFVSVTYELDDQTITVTGGGKTRINRDTLNRYLETAVVEEEIETLDFSDLTDEPAPIELEKTMILQPVSNEPEIPVEPVTPMVQPELPQETPFVSEPTSVVEATPMVETTPVVEENPVTEEPETGVSEDDSFKEIEEKPKKKKGLTFVIILLVLALLGAGGYFGYQWIKDNNRKADEKEEEKKEEPSTLISLEQIGQKLRGLSFVTDIEKEGGEVLITYTSSMLDVKVTEEETSEYQYELDDNAIEVTYAKDDALGKKLTEYVYASVQELLGNDRSEVLKRVKEGFTNPTLETEGISYKEVGVNVTVKISLKTKLDISNVDLTGPISKELFTTHKEDLTNDKALSLQYGEVFFEKKKEDNELVIFVIQKKPITEDAYETFLNYLTVAYDEAKANDFKKNYPTFDATPDVETDYKVSLKGTLPEEYSTKYSRAEYEWVEIRMGE